MKRNFIFTAVLLLTVLLGISCHAEDTSKTVQRPKLVVGIVIDQMRWDYLYRYNDLYCEGGFKRLMREGRNYENTMINYIPSVTCIGHTSIYTGTVPAVHGMTGNYFYDGDKYVYCCEDETVNGVGTSTAAGKMSPRRMLCTTIGDELKIATDFNAKVIGIALKDRSAIMPAGHAADAAYWFDYETATFVSSTYYMTKQPQWLESFNKTIGKATKADVQYTNLGNQLTEQLAEEVIKGERLGQEGRTDMLTISFSCTDMIGHKYGTHHEKTQQVFVDVDKRLSALFDFLDRTVGRGQYLAFLTADHGAANNILMMQEHNIPADGFFSEKVKNALNEHLKAKFGTAENLVTSIDSYRVKLNHKAIASLQSANINDVKDAVIDYIKQDDNVAYIVDYERLSQATMPYIIKEKITNGYYASRSSDLQIIMKPAHYEVSGKEIDRGTTHGVWNPYDAHIPFLLMGWHVRPGAVHDETYITDIAPTVCSMLHIQMPNGCIGRSVEDR